MITQDQLDTVIGSTAYDKDGDKIGKIGAIYYDDATTSLPGSPCTPACSARRRRSFPYRAPRSPATA